MGMKIYQVDKCSHVKPWTILLSRHYGGNNIPFIVTFSNVSFVHGFEQMTSKLKNQQKNTSECFLRGTNAYSFLCQVLEIGDLFNRYCVAEKYVIKKTRAYGMTVFDNHLFDSRFIFISIYTSLPHGTCCLESIHKM